MGDFEFTEFAESRQYLSLQLPSSDEASYFKFHNEILRRASNTPFFRVIFNVLLYEGGLKENFVAAVRRCQSRSLYFALKELYLQFMKEEIGEQDAKLGQ